MNNNLLTLVCNVGFRLAPNLGSDPDALKLLTLRGVKSDPKRNRFATFTSVQSKFLLHNVTQCSIDCDQITLANCVGFRLN